MATSHHYNALVGAYPQEHLIEQGKRNGLNWEESKDPGVNWMRFSKRLHDHLTDGNEFHVDNAHPEGLKTMLSHYVHLKELHKQSMVPHVRAAMGKIHSERGHTVPNSELLKEAYKHLEANGGRGWAEKVSDLHHINTHIEKLSSRIKSMGHVIPQ